MNTRSTCNGVRHPRSARVISAASRATPTATLRAAAANRSACVTPNTPARSSAATTGNLVANVTARLTRADADPGDTPNTSPNSSDAHRWFNRAASESPTTGIINRSHATNAASCNACTRDRNRSVASINPNSSGLVQRPRIGARQHVHVLRNRLRQQLDHTYDSRVDHRQRAEPRSQTRQCRDPASATAETVLADPRVRGSQGEKPQHESIFPR